MPNRIALYARSETRFLMTAIAVELKRRTGASIILYCGNRQEEIFYASMNEGGVFSRIINFGPLIRKRLEIISSDEAALTEAQRWENKLGITINALAITNRHLGRGYALGGFYHPRSRTSENSGYYDLLRHYCANLAYWNEELLAHDFDLILNGNKELSIVARALDIPYRVINGSRFLNLHNWAWNEFYENGEIEPTYRTLCESANHVAELATPYTSHIEFRNWFVNQSSAFALLKRGVREVAKYAYWHLRRYEKARGYYLHENLRYFFRIWIDSRRLLRIARTRLSDLEGKRFAFYPLHLEPEASLQGLSPEYFYQLSLIAAVSRDLPAGVILVVKEHMSAIGRRPKNFYDQISEFKNVVLLDPTELGLNCVRAAAVTITICGTAGFEAAVLGKPVIAFGRHNVYGFLPHVRVVVKESELAGYLRQALSDVTCNKHARADGARFLAAVKACSFDLRDYSYRVLTNFEPQTVQSACDALLRSLSSANQPQLLSQLKHP